MCVVSGESGGRAGHGQEGGPRAGGRREDSGKSEGEGSGGLEIVRRVISGDPCGAEGQAVAPGLRMTDRHLLELGGHCPCGITT